MHSHTQEYVKNLFEMYKKIIYNEFNYLRRKHELFTSQDYEKLKELIFEQRKEFQVVLRHTLFYETHMDLISVELGINIQELNSQELNRLHNLFTKDNFIGGFIVKHSNIFLEILNKQLQSLKNRGGILGKLDVFRFGTIENNLQKEEEVYNELLSLFIQRIEFMQKYINYENKHELYESIKGYVFKASITITAVPIGPLELLSIPFWGVYFVMNEWEKHSQEFGEWRKIKRRRIMK